MFNWVEGYRVYYNYFYYNDHPHDYFCDNFRS